MTAVAPEAVSEVIEEIESREPERSEVWLHALIGSSKEYKQMISA